MLNPYFIILHYAQFDLGLTWFTLSNIPLTLLINCPLTLLLQTLTTWTHNCILTLCTLYWSCQVSSITCQPSLGFTRFDYWLLLNLAILYLVLTWGQPWLQHSPPPNPMSILCPLQMVSKVKRLTRLDWMFVVDQRKLFEILCWVGLDWWVVWVEKTKNRV